MAAYVKLFTDFVETFDEMSDAEAGRLIKAVLAYGACGEMRTLSGGERLIFGILKRQIDRDNGSAEAHRESGKAGGRPKKQNQTEPNETKQNQIEPNGTKQNQDEPNSPDKDNDNKTIRQRQQDKDNDNDNDPARSELSLSAEDVRKGIELDQRIEAAARDVGLQITAAGMQTAHNLGGTYGYDRLIEAIRASVDVPKWSYVEGILRNYGKGKPAKAQAKANPALNYSQRSYSEKPDMPDWLREELEQEAAV